jgi:catechol 2,3-dioxygenase-like lactoylglutathione lyase family enzyme
VLDHVSVPVADFQRSKAFYRAALAPLGYDLVAELEPEQGGGSAYAGFGPAGRPQFWIVGGPPLSGRLHMAFRARERADVRNFHSAALGAGGGDNGPPGLRPEYHANYYAAFVLDPDGHNIEAVCHAPGRFEDQFAR